jgi:hypothetical protein
MLNAHPSIAIAVDAYLPLLRSFRNAAIRSRCETSLAVQYTGAPLQDYYFTDERLAAMDAVQAATPTTAFDNSERDYLLAALSARAGLEAPDLVPLLQSLVGNTYGDLFDKAIDIVAEARKATSKRWVGIKEVWSIEFCNVLATLYPNAKFIVIMRDPRAVVASMRVLAGKDPSQRAHTLSYVRHWRKFVAYYDHYLSKPEFRGRLLVIRYEDLVSEPTIVAESVCSFLGIEVAESMTAKEGYRNQALGSVWSHNSSYEMVKPGIDGSLAERWRAALEPSVKRMITLVCGAEMQLLGYCDDQEIIAEDSGILDFLAQDAVAACSWRSDLGDPHLDYQMELHRRALLSGAIPATDRQHVRRNFLFEDMFELLRSPQRAAHDRDDEISA